MEDEELSSVKMLGLKLPTDPRWVNIAEKSIHEILIDHAFCEQKAATTGISLIVRYSDKEKLVQEVTPLVAEEWGHFRRVLKELDKRGFKLGRKRKDLYVVQLQAQQIKGIAGMQMLEQLLISALIEARSCERFKVLSENIQDEELAKFYRLLMESEAGHYTTFITYARKYGHGIDVEKRWREWIDFEASVIANYGKSESIHG